LYFAANDGTNGYELWKSNGTAAGTVLVKNINPGINNSYPDSFTNVNGTLYFRANDGTNGEELWKSDGTAAGTVLVKNINPGINNSDPGYFTNVNGTLYFTANDGANGRELWKSNGTTAGTVLVKNINPGINNSDPDSFTNVNGTLYFTANNGANGRELWKSNGTAAGTVMVANLARDPIDLGTGQLVPTSSDPGYLTNVNGTLYFSATDTVFQRWSTGEELYKSNGTSAGTVLVKDIVPGRGSSYPIDLTTVGGTVYFGVYIASGQWELWKSNGTAAGTVKVYP
jgi:trimeric autotransporter adhesin